MIWGLPIWTGQSDEEVLTTTVEAAAAAERAGFDDVWLAEHHFMSYGICPSTVTLAAYVLGGTRRIAVGTAVSTLSTRHPVALAEQAVLLDQVSAGRFRLGVGRGGPWVDLEVFATGLDRYESGFAEALDLLLAAVPGGPAAAAGTFFRFREVTVVPRSRTRPHPPVVVAATSPATAELAAARGLPMLLGLHMDDAGKHDMMSHYAAAAARHQTRPAGRHMAAVAAQVGDTRLEAQRLLRTELPRWLGPGLAGYIPVDGRQRAARDPVSHLIWAARSWPERDAAGAVRADYGQHRAQYRLPEQELEDLCLHREDIAAEGAATACPAADPGDRYPADSRAWRGEKFEVGRRFGDFAGCRRQDCSNCSRILRDIASASLYEVVRAGCCAR